MKLKTKELQEETSKSTITLGDTNTPLSRTNGTQIKNQSYKYSEYLNNMINKFDLMDTYRMVC